MTDQEYYKNFSNKILKDKKNQNQEDESKILYFTLAGSHSFNLNVETSDKDYFGVYATDIDDVLVGDIKQPIIDSHEPDDYVIFEVDRFCELLYKGNPKLIEPIFTSRFCYKSPIWELLCNNKKEFISQSAIYHFLSYSKSQMGDASKIIFNSNSSSSSSSSSSTTEDEEDKKKLLLNLINSNHNHHKKLYHTYRLLLDTQRMLDGKEPLVYLEGEDREKVMKIRMGEQEITQTLSEIQKLFKDCQSRFDLVKEKNLIQENLNIKVLNDWLIQVRKQSYLQKEAANAIPTIKYSDSDFEINDIKSYNLLKVYNQFQSLLEKHKIPDAKILMIKRSGSVSHNLMSDDDQDQQDSNKKEDWIGVYIAPTESIFSLYPPPRRIDLTTQLSTASKIEEPEDSSNQRDTYLAGIQLFELGYFITLLSSGNHRAVECIYDFNTGGDLVETNIWKDIKSLGRNGGNNNYLTVNLIHHCWGVSKGLIDKISKSNNNNNNNNATILPLSEKRKSLYHAQRLINRADEILDKSNYTVYLDDEIDQIERDLLLKIKYSKDLTSDQLSTLVSNCSTQIQSVNDKIKKLSNISSKDKKLNELSIKQSLKSILIKIRKSMIKIVI